MAGVKQSKIKQILIPTLCLFLICVIIAALLSITNSITADKINEQQKIKKSDSCKVALNIASSFNEKTLDDFTYYEGFDNDHKTVGYVFITESKGYSSTLQVMTGVDTNNSVEGVVILSQSETPGLGTNAAKDEFRNQFKQGMPPKNSFNVVKSDAKSGDIKALTGATITSKAVVSAVNKALENYNMLKETGVKNNG